MIIRLALAIILVLCADLENASADHCPEGSITDARPETQLARIDFVRGHFPNVLHLYGRPVSSHEETDSSYPRGSGEATYTWKMGSALLEVSTMFYHSGDKRIETAVGVRIDGVTPVGGLETSRGLKLGDTFVHATELYGATYLDHPVNGPDLPGKTRTFCFADGTELGVGVNRSGKVTAIWLAPLNE